MLDEINTHGKHQNQEKQRETVSLSKNGQRNKENWIIKEKILWNNKRHEALENHNYPGHEGSQQTMFIKVSLKDSPERSQTRRHIKDIILQGN